MITGSPHKDGTSNVLACEFIRGAEEAGHDVYRFDAAFEDVSPCRGCDSCRVHGGKCVYSDSMDKIYEKITTFSQYIVYHICDKKSRFSTKKPNLFLLCCLFLTKEFLTDWLYCLLSFQQIL